MPQLNFYVPAPVEKAIRKEAKNRRKNLSSYLAEVVKEHLQPQQWQKDFFRKVVGGWKGDFPEIERLSAEEPPEL